MKKAQTDKQSIKYLEWNLTPLFSSDKDPNIEKNQQAVEKANMTFIKKWKDRIDYLENPKVLRQALDEYEELQNKFGTDGDVGYYFWLRMMQDQNNPDIKASFTKSQDFSNRLQNQRQFFELNLAKIPKNKQKVFLKDKLLSQYKHFLERIFAQSEHVLSDAEEKILTLKTDPSYSKWVQMVSGFVTKEQRRVLTDSGKKELVPFEALTSLMSSQKKKVRDDAAKAFNDILAKYAEVAENEMNAVLQNKKIDDELRGFKRPDSSRHLSDDVDETVVDTLIQTVASRYDIAKRFYKLKAKLLGLPKLAYHERNIEYGSLEKDYSYEDGVTLVSKVFADLDPQFAEIFNRFVQSGQIDVYPRPGKRGGAFCVYVLKSQPTYLMLNYNNKLRDVSTLSHEMGHAINDELMKKQNALNFGTPTSTAEVASTFMEDFVTQELLKTADDELRLALQVSKLNYDVSAIFRQIACYQFEQELHKTFREKGYLSLKEIGQIFQKHMSAYMGPAVTQDPGSENWWIYWNHIRMFFYVYSYAGGIIAKAMQNNVKENHAFVEKVKDFLSAGTSDSPKNIFKKLGIDITDQNFWNRGLDEIENLLKDTEKLAKELEKI